MISQERSRNALLAIQYILVRVRKMAYDHAPYDEIATILDAAEYLPGLMCQVEDCTNEFRSVLDELAQQQGLSHALELFDSEVE